LTPATNNWISVTAINWGNLSATTTGPTTFSIFSSSNNYASPVATGTATANGTWALVNTALSTPITGFTSTALTIRIYASGGVGTQPSAPNWRIDDLKITATAQVGESGNAIPKYLTATTYTSSIMIESNGKIGIGQSLPSEKLDVAGGIKFNGPLLAGSPTPTGGVSGQFLKSTGPTTAPIWDAAPGGGASGWNLTGNAATAPGTNFIGTTDAQRLVFKTGGVEQATILANGNLGIGIAAPTSRLHLPLSSNIAIGTPDISFTEGAALSSSELRFRTNENFVTSIMPLPGWTELQIVNKGLGALGGIRANLAKVNSIYSMNNYIVANVLDGQLQIGGQGYGGVPFYVKESGGTTDNWADMVIEGSKTAAAASSIPLNLHLKPRINIDNGTTGISFGGTNSGGVDRSNGSQAGIYVRSSAVSGTTMKFATTNNYSSGAQMRMTIDPIGNVGIGTENPSYLLHVNGEVFVPNRIGAFKAGIYSSISETGGGNALVQGNNIKASSINVNKLVKSTGTDAAQYINMRYDRGIYFGTGVGVGDNAGTEYADSVNTRMVIGLDGKVGIGTKTPTAILDVQSTTNGVAFPRMTTAQKNAIVTPVAGLEVYDLDLKQKSFYNGTAWVQSLSAGAGGGTAWLIGGNVGTNPGTDFIGTKDNKDFVFKTNADVGGNERMRILANGNIGIGIALPSTTLHSVGLSGSSTWAGDANYYGGGKSHYYNIYGDQYGNGAPYTYGATNLNYVYAYHGGKAGGYFKGGSGYPLAGGGAGISAIGGDGGIGGGGTGVGGGAGIYAKGGMNGDNITRAFAGYFAGGNVAVMDGSVGIGTTTPVTKLDVNGALTISGGGSAYISQANKIQITSGFGTPISGRVLFGDFTGWKINFSALKPNLSNPASPILVDNFTFVDNGKLGINNTNPVHALDVMGSVFANDKIFIGTRGDGTTGNPALTPTQLQGNYKLFVNGSAIFTKAVVKLTSNWADYVFEPTYNLPTLSQVEAYITKHKHLEGVPSAAEVKEKGIDLGDNQTILLKKVEELTLYIIDQDKKIVKLQAEKDELKNMQKQIDELKAMLLKK
jgi:hypothetical protein